MDGYLELPLTTFLIELNDDQKTLKYSGLIQLSDLHSSEILEFERIWGSVCLLRRQEVLKKLVELSLEHLELNFSSVFKYCLNDENDEVRLKAVQGLWECDDRSLIPSLIEVLEGDHDGMVRAEAAISLGRFASMIHTNKVLSSDAEKIRNALVRAIECAENDFDVKRRAIESVAFFDDPAIDEMIRKAHGSGDQGFKQSSLYAMGQSSNIRWLPVLLDNLYDEYPGIRYEAIHAIGNLGDESTAPQLIRLIDDEDLQVRLASVRAVGAVGGQLARQALTQCLETEDEVIKAAAREALDDLKFDDDPLGF